MSRRRTIALSLRWGSIALPLRRGSIALFLRRWAGTLPGRRSALFGAGRRPIGSGRWTLLVGSVGLIGVNAAAKSHGRSKQCG